MRTVHRQRFSARSLGLLLALSLSGCDSEPHRLGVDEPIVVLEADFKHGALPEAKQGPRITAIETLDTNKFHQGAFHVSFAGRASDDAHAIGVRLLDQGSGYWVRAVGSENLLAPGEYDWDASFNVGTEVEPGKHKLGVVAFDKHGKPGPHYTLDVCVLSDVPDLGNVCDPKIEPPAAVATLRWNVAADLDLIVIAPDGTRYDHTNFSRLSGDEVAARLDADGSAGCVGDGDTVENFVWNVPPQKGTWFIYANLFDACQKSAVRFDLTVYRRKKHEQKTFSLEAERSVGGELLRAQSTPGATIPLYVTQVTFP